MEQGVTDGALDGIGGVGAREEVCEILLEGEEILVERGGDVGEVEVEERC